MNPNAPVTESINQRILELLGLEETFDLDYATYTQSLKERLLRVTAFGEKLPTEDFKLLKDELKRVKQKEKTKTFKINPDKLLGKKETQSKAKITPKKLLLPSSGALSKVSEVENKSKIIQRLKPSEKEPTDILSRIDEKLSSILETLISASKLQNKQLELDRKERENKKRQDKESRLEKGGKLVGAVVQKILKPFQSIFDRVWNFIKFTLLGRAFTLLMNWFADPKNKGKVETLGRFLKDWWPALLFAVTAFTNPFGGLVKSVIGTVVRFTFKITKFAIPKLLSLVKANPYATAALAAGIGGYYASQQNEQKREGVKPGEGTPGGSQLQREQVLQRGLGGAFNGGAYVEGAKGVDKIPAWLSDGEFVISRGAVNKFGVPFFETLNAAGGGTNKPKVVNGTTYAQGGGPVGNSRRGGEEGYRPEKNDKNSVFYFINKFFRDRNVGGPNFDIRNPRTWNKPSQSGNNLPKSGGGSGGFLGGLGFVGRSAGQVPTIANRGLDYAGRVAGEAGKRVTPAIDYAGRVTGEAGKRVTEGLSKAAEIPKGIYQALTAPEVGATIMGYGDAGAEAIPAIISGFLGIERTDKSISRSMQKAILDAQKTAQSKRRNFIEYEDYAETAGGIAGKYTMGRIADSEFLRDSKGRIIGMTQAYDTNRPAKESMLQAEMAVRRFFGVDNSKQSRELNSLTKSRLSKEGVEPDVISKSMVKPGGAKFQFGDVKTALYKPFEALLDVSQKQWGGKGATNHEVLFDEKVLGFKPVEAAPKPGSKDYEAFIAGGGNAALSGGKTVRDIVRSGRPLTDKNLINQRKLEAKRPWWDKMGMFGGASAQIAREQQEKKDFEKKNPGATLYKKPQSATKPKPYVGKARRRNSGGFLDISTNFGIDTSVFGPDTQYSPTFNAAFQPGEGLVDFDYVLTKDAMMNGARDQLVSFAEQLNSSFDSNSNARKQGIVPKDISIPKITPYSSSSSTMTLPPIKSSSGGSGSMPTSPSSLPDFSVVPADGAPMRMANARLLGLVG